MHWNSAPRGLREHYRRMKQQDNADMHNVCIFSAHVPAPWSHWTSLTKHKFKDKVMNFKAANSRAAKQAWGSPEHRVLWECTGHLPMKPVLLPVFYRVSLNSFKQNTRPLMIRPVPHLFLRSPSYFLCPTEFFLL